MTMGMHTQIRFGVFLLTLGLLAQAPPQAKPASSNPGATAAAKGPTDLWPQTISGGKVKFQIYQPQVDSWNGTVLRAYCAVEATPSGENNPSFGLLRFTAHTSVNHQMRMVYFDSYQVEQIEFPGAAERAGQLQSALRISSVKTINKISLDRFESALAAADAAKHAATIELKNDPPKVIFQVVPSMLVLVDGDPVFKPWPKQSLERVINARPLILKDDDKLYLHLFDGWLESSSLTGDWSLAGRKPRELNKILEEARKNPQIDLLEGQADPETKAKPKLEKGKVPMVIVSTTPAELIVSEGEWQWEAIPTTKLEFVKNTTGNIFRSTPNNEIYILIAGRWFTAKDRSGPWEFVRGGSLPVDFANIPDDSPKENVKASVPGTAQAEEAVIANMIPHTAVVKRADAKLTPPVFDGDPQFKPIEGTTLQYVANTPTPIIEVSDREFYALENGVWFKAESVKGPWKITEIVPTLIYGIPPSSPLYYVTFVKVYGSSSDTVTVGYTPGYFGSVTTSSPSPVVVYGTGYYYTPWVGSYWYGAPVTYGFGTAMTYTPWTGWTVGFGFGWSYGWGSMTVGWGWGCYPWWGPMGWGWYYPPPLYMGGAAWGPMGAAAWGPYGGWAATTNNIYGRWGNTAYVRRDYGGYNPWTGNRWSGQVGRSYNSRTGTLAAGQRAAVGNVYTGNYAYGGRGAAFNSPTGISGAAGRVTVGNAGSGNQATISRGAINNPNTGNTTRFGGVRTDQGSVGHVGDNVFGSKDGNVYRYNNGGWEQVTRGSGNVDSQRMQNLNRERDFRMQGSGRFEGFQGGPAFHGGGFRGGGFRRR